MESSLGDRLVGLLGQNAVLPVDGYEVDGQTPQAVVRPADKLQASELLRWASAENVAVTPWGGGTRMGLGNAPRQTDVVLDTARLDRVIDYQPADMTATVEAGVTLAALQEQLAPGGEFVPLETALPGRSTIGGILSVGMGGPLSTSYGLPREWLIGISVLDAAGVATKAGGKVVKNVTGYDLNKLYAGSLGTLGVITEASFKLLPIDPESGALMASFPTLQTALSGGRKLLHSTAAPMGYQSVTFGASRRLQDSLHAASQDLGLGDEETALSLAFYSGRANATERRLEEGAAQLLSEGAIAVQRIEGAGSNGLLRWLTDAPTEIGTNSALVMKVSVQSKMAASASSECAGITLSSQAPDQIADPGFGSLRLFWPRPDDIQSAHFMEPQLFVDTINQVRQIAHRYGGSAVVERCPLPVKAEIDVWGNAPDSLAVMQRIKEKFDPAGILNPGRFLGGI